MAAPILALASAAAGSALARTLWLQGHPVAAMAFVDKTITDNAISDHPVTLLVALMYAVSVQIWNGDLDDAAEQIRRFMANARTYDLKSHVVLGRCFEGQLAISRGHYEHGVGLLQKNLLDLHALHYQLLTTSFRISLVQAFAEVGRFADGMSVLEEAMKAVETNGDLCYLPEILRLKADLLLSLPKPEDELAEACLAESLTLSRRQGALAWELRTSIDLARRLAAQGMPERAVALLKPVLDRFAEGSSTADLKFAKTLLSGWD